MYILVIMISKTSQSDHKYKLIIIIGDMLVSRSLYTFLHLFIMTRTVLFMLTGGVKLSNKSHIPFMIFLHIYGTLTFGAPTEVSQRPVIIISISQNV